MSSLNTNIAAMTALQTLNQTNKEMLTVQSRVATGLRVSTAADNAAYWSIATTMRSDNRAPLDRSGRPRSRCCYRRGHDNGVERGDRNGERDQEEARRGARSGSGPDQDPERDLPAADATPRHGGRRGLLGPELALGRFRRRRRRAQSWHRSPATAPASFRSARSRSTSAPQVPCSSIARAAAPAFSIRSMQPPFRWTPSGWTRTGSRGSSTCSRCEFCRGADVRRCGTSSCARAPLPS